MYCQLLLLCGIILQKQWEDSSSGRLLQDHQRVQGAWVRGLCAAPEAFDCCFWSPSSGIWARWHWFSWWPSPDRCLVEKLRPWALCFPLPWPRGVLFRGWPLLEISKPPTELHSSSPQSLHCLCFPTIAKYNGGLHNTAQTSVMTSGPLKRSSGPSNPFMEGKGFHPSLRDRVIDYPSSLWAAEWNLEPPRHPIPLQSPPP